MKLLLLAEHDNQTLSTTNYHTLTAAQQLEKNIDLLIIGHDCKNVVKAAQKLPNIQKIRLADNPDYAHQLAENCAQLIANLAKEYDYIVASANSMGKNCLPRVAGILNLSMISDVVKILSPDTFERYIYAGNALVTLSTKETIKLLTVRTTAFDAAQPVEQQETQIEKINTIISNTGTQFIKQELSANNRPALNDARIIISGGRGFKNAENFKLLESLADKLGAAIGASRAAVDAGFAPNDYQVGQTGKVVAPDLYIAIGISGAIQHLAGMKDSKVIVAINNDPEAPIFAIADYGLVADLFEAITEIEKHIKDE